MGTNLQSRRFSGFCVIKLYLRTKVSWSRRMARLKRGGEVLPHVRTESSLTPLEKPKFIGPTHSVTTGTYYKYKVTHTITINRQCTKLVPDSCKGIFCRPIFKSLYIILILVKIHTDS